MDDPIRSEAGENEFAEVEGHRRPRPRTGEDDASDVALRRPRPRTGEDDEPDFEGHRRPRP